MYFTKMASRTLGIVFPHKRHDHSFKGRGHSRAAPLCRAVRNWISTSALFLHLSVAYYRVVGPNLDVLAFKSLKMNRSRGVDSPRAQEHYLTPSGCEDMDY